MRPLTLAALLLIVAGCKKEEVAPPAPPPAAKPAPVAPVAQPVEAAPTKGQRVEMQVTADGFVPADIKVKVNEPVTLVITRKTDETCATELTIDGTELSVPLPLDKAVEVAWTPTKTGKVKYGCAMDKMVGGLLIVE